MAIRTLVEVRGGRVSIVEDGNETQVKITWDDQASYDPDQAVEAMAGDYVRAQDEIRELKDDLASVRGRVDGQVDRIRDLVAERDALLLKIKSMESDLSGYAEGRDISGDKIRSLEAERDTHKREREENREWAERTEDHLETRTRERDVATNKLSLIRSALTHRELPHSERVSNALALLD